jgi:ribosomal protein L24E
MRQVWDTSLDNRIKSFLNRKSEEFPELGLKKRPNNLKYTTKYRYTDFTV